MDFDVALSFAGEDREFVDQVANYLRAAGVKVFYDKFEQVDMWGKDLYELLDRVYRKEARFTVIFASQHYARKLWPRHERRSAQARALGEHAEYILPARFDNTEVPGLPDTIHYLDLKKISAKALADAVCEKLVRSGVVLKRTTPMLAGSRLVRSAVDRIIIKVVSENGEGLSGVELYLVAANGTYLSGRTGQDGATALEVTKRGLVSIFCVHPEKPAFLAEGFDPISDFRITLPVMRGVGSQISLGGWDRLPGLSGEINPICDGLNRLYVYTKNISVDGNSLQPTPFELGKELHCEDAAGNELLVTFVAAVGRCFLIQHRRYPEETSY